MTAGKGEEAERFLKGAGSVGIPEIPAWKDLVRSVLGHQCSETFFQPQPIPVPHCNQVTEPNMKDLIKNSLCDSLLGIQSRVFWVEQKICSPENDSSPVLHRSRGKFGNPDQIEFWKPVGQLKAVFEKLQALGCKVPCEGSLFLTAKRTKDRYGDPAV
ncbi:hypothetical protein F25303_3847 [Fusarium sp. NRRL 25303]|nr:hypothetical protein F25303_3847 [Fusarium sp. NRRL 25303]